MGSDSREEIGGIWRKGMRSETKNFVEGMDKR